MRCIFLAALLAATAPLPADELPRLRDLLPENTLSYVEVRDYQQLTARLQKSALGRMAREPELAQFVETVTQALLDYQFPASAVARQRGETGGIANAWRELSAAPLGQIVVAMIAADEERIPVVMVECRSDLLPRLIDDQLAAMVRRGAEETIERADGGKLRIVEHRGSRATLAAVLQRDGVYVLCDNPEILRQIAQAWSGSRAHCLASNERFRKWQQRQAAELEPPESGDVQWFADLAKMIMPQDAAPARNSRRTTQPAIDPGIEAVWGELRLAENRADVLIHVELMLSQPRAGLGKLLAFVPGETTAEDWTPREASSYSTLRWDARRTVAALQEPDAAALGAAVATVHELPKGLPESLEKWLALLDDRVSHAAWWPEPPQPGPAQIWGVRVRSPDEALAPAEEFLSRDALSKQEETHRGRHYVTLTFPRQVLCLGTYDRQLLVSNSPQAMQRAIDAALSPSERLAEQIDYRVVASQVRRLSSDQSAAAHFARPVDYLRRLHALLGSESLHDALRAEAEHLPWLISLQRALAAQPLPDFALIEKHCAPGGSVIFQTPDAVVWKAFLLRRK